MHSAYTFTCPKLVSPIPTLMAHSHLCITGAFRDSGAGAGVGFGNF